ncbi:hypothetical protein [Fontivita pretiosa]|uniref:hypothetical protein n=1 Tax=Fontivita pretiosa TaxID=2989684 RepID=UPI003D171F89
MTSESDPTADTFRGVVTTYDLGYRAPEPLSELGRQGLYPDEEFGLVYNRAWMLHTGMGRFVQRDPSEYRDSTSMTALD